MADFLRLKSTGDYIVLLEERYGNSHIATPREILRVVKGGDAAEGLQGAWMDEKLALKFAAWLSPRFEFWVYDRIQELPPRNSIRRWARPTSISIRRCSPECRQKRSDYDDLGQKNNL